MRARASMVPRSTTVRRAVAARPFPPGGVLRDPPEGARQRFVIARRHQKPRNPVVDDLRDPPTFVATAGRPAAIPSSRATGWHSSLEERQIAHAAARYGRGSIRSPTMWTRPRRPSPWASVSRRARSGPSPTRIRCPGVCSIAVSMVPISFTGARRATQRKTGSSARIPSSRRACSGSGRSAQESDRSHWESRRRRSAGMAMVARSQSLVPPKRR